MLSRFTARAITTIAVVIAILIGGSTGAAFAAGNALPGDALYSVKTTLEDAQLAFSDDEGDVELYNQFANTRVEEIKTLVDEGRYEDIPAAVQAYQETNEGLGKAFGKLSSGNPENAGDLTAVLERAREQRTMTLTNMLQRVPEQAQKAIQNALDAGPPDGKGKPDDKGKPEGVGVPPDDKGKPEKPGCPPVDKGGKPDDVGDQGQGNGQDGQDVGNGQSGTGGSPDRECGPSSTEEGGTEGENGGSETPEP